MNARPKLIAAGLASLALVAVGQATAEVIDFEGFSNGATVTSSGIISSITASGGFNQARIFNTAASNNAGNVATDPDLIAPFSEIGGGQVLSPGNVLIIQDNANGGTLTFMFAGPITVLSMNVFDADGGTVKFFGSGGQIGTTVNLGNSDDTANGAGNWYEALTFGATGVANVTKMELYFTKSGAVDDITVVPLPAAAWLFGSALLGVIGIGSRRRARASA